MQRSKALLKSVLSVCAVVGVMGWGSTRPADVHAGGEMLQLIGKDAPMPIIVHSDEKDPGDNPLVSYAAQDLQGYLGECRKAIEKGVRRKGYFLWSFMDNFEWTRGYTRRFGVHYVDFATGKRIPKSSAAWFGRVVRENGF